jgi:hypothetical protein
MLRAGFEHVNLMFRKLKLPRDLDCTATMIGYVRLKVLIQGNNKDVFGYNVYFLTTCFCLEYEWNSVIGFKLNVVAEWLTLQHCIREASGLDSCSRRQLFGQAFHGSHGTLKRLNHFLLYHSKSLISSSNDTAQTMHL